MALIPAYTPIVRPTSWNGDVLVNGKLGPCDLKPVHFAGVGNLDLHAAAAAQSFECMVMVCHAETGLSLSGTGAYRSYVQQVSLFTANYLNHYDAALTAGADGTQRRWNGVTWYRKKGHSAVASPGTSNHGLAIAVDLGWWQGWDEPGLADIDGVTNPIYATGWNWLLANYQSFGWSHEGARPGEPGYEPWHVRYVLGNAKSERVLAIERLFAGAPA